MDTKQPPPVSQPYDPVITQLEVTERLKEVGIHFPQAPGAAGGHGWDPKWVTMGTFSSWALNVVASGKPLQAWGHHV